VLVHVPLALARPLVALATRFVPWAPITSDQLAMLEEGSSADPGEAERAFGVRMRPLGGVFGDAPAPAEAA